MKMTFFALFLKKLRWPSLYWKDPINIGPGYPAAPHQASPQASAMDDKAERFSVRTNLFPGSTSASYFFWVECRSTRLCCHYFALVLTPLLALLYHMLAKGLSG
jgi:hypothetical protein